MTNDNEWTEWVQHDGKGCPCVGQMVEDVRLAVNGRRPVDFKGRMGGIIPTPEEILAEVERLMEPVRV